MKITGMNPAEEIPPEVAHRAYFRQPVWKRDRRDRRRAGGQHRRSRSVLLAGIYWATAPGAALARGAVERRLAGRGGAASPATGSSPSTASRPRGYNCALRYSTSLRWTSCAQRLGPNVEIKSQLAGEAQLEDYIDQFYGYELSVDGILQEIETGEIDYKPRRGGRRIHAADGAAGQRAAGRRGKARRIRHPLRARVRISAHALPYRRRARDGAQPAQELPAGHHGAHQSVSAT